MLPHQQTPESAKKLYQENQGHVAKNQGMELLQSGSRSINKEVIFLLASIRISNNKSYVVSSPSLIVHILVFVRDLNSLEMFLY